MNAIRGIQPNQAGELTSVAKEQFAQAKGLQEERLEVRDQFSKLAFAVGLSGVVVGVCGMVCAATLFPLKTRVVEYYTVNQNTGYVGPSVGASDAPTLFSEQVTQAALQAYVEARENYVYQTDPVAFHRVTLMSAPDEQTRYKEMHDAPTGPSRALRDKGYVQVDNFQFWLVGDGKAHTKQYVVKFDRREMRTGDQVPAKGMPYTAQIDFQFHPEYPMATPDRRLNPWGLYVLSYRVGSDDQSRKTN